MNVNTVNTEHLENDNRFIGLEVFKAIESNGPAEKGKFESCFRKTRSIVFTIALLALILLVFIILILVLNSVTTKQLKTLDMQVSELQQHTMEEQDNLNTKVANLTNLMDKICTECPIGWYAIGSSCYYLSVEQRTWYGALKECFKVNSFLAMITDRKKSAVCGIAAQSHSLEYVQYHLQLLKKKSVRDAVNSLFTGSIRYWIGLRRDPKKIHIWKWLDRTEVTFTNWAVNEPNYLERSEHCGETWSGPWNDENCIVSLNYICEKKRSCLESLYS